MKLLSTIDFAKLTLPAVEARPSDPCHTTRRGFTYSGNDWEWDKGSVGRGNYSFYPRREHPIVGRRKKIRESLENPKPDMLTTTLWFNGNQAFVFEGHLPDEEVVAIISIFEQGRAVGVLDGTSAEQRRVRNLLGL